MLLETRNLLIQFSHSINNTSLFVIAFVSLARFQVFAHRSGHIALPRSGPDEAANGKDANSLPPTCRHAEKLWRPLYAPSLNALAPAKQNAFPCACAVRKPAELLQRAEADRAFRPGAPMAPGHPSLVCHSLGCDELAANELHSHLRHAVRLRKHGDSRLGKNLIAYELGHFRRHVHIGDA